MSFVRRLGYFLFGLSIGIVFLTFFLKKKTQETGVSFCYLPDCRTLKDIRSKPMSYSEEVQGLFQNQTIDTLEIKDILTNGDVNFGLSDTKSVPCKTYYVEGEISDKEAVLKITNCRKKVVLESVSFTKS